MFGSVESLNVSVASGVCLYEARRQRIAIGLTISKLQTNPAHHYSAAAISVHDPITGFTLASLRIAFPHLYISCSIACAKTSPTS
jgi:hypothetical protein